jgi:hypothetical protein
MLAPLVLIDRRLGELRATLATVRENLAALDADVTLQMLMSSTTLRGRSVVLRDETVARCKHLWEGLLALDDAFETLVVLRGSRSYLSRSKADQLTSLLDAAPVALSPFGGKAATPQLTSAGGSGATIPLSEVLEGMSAEYQEVLRIVALANTAWMETAPRAAALVVTVGEVVSFFEQSGRRRPNELTPLREELEQLERDAREDPLATDPGRLDGPGEQLARLRASIDEAMVAEQHLDEEAATLASSLRECGAMLAAVRAAEGSDAAKVARSDDSLEQLAHAEVELEELERQLGSLRLQITSAPEEATRLSKRMAERTAALRASLGALGSAEAWGLEARDELRGLLEALWAKAQAIGRIEDPEVRALHRQAQDALYSAPCDVLGARDLVEQLQGTLRVSPSSETRAGDER